MDWGQNESLAVCLASSLYLLIENGDSINLIILENDSEYISSVSWMPNSQFLAIGVSDSTVYKNFKIIKRYNCGM